MSELEQALAAEGRAKPAQKRFEITRQDRFLLAGALLFCLLFTDVFLSSGATAAGLTAVVFGWYTLTLAGTGASPLANREHRLLLLFNLFLAVMLGLRSNGAFQFWNTLALLVLIPLHTVALTGAAALPWYCPAMLRERSRLLARGLFCRLGAARDALIPARKEGAVSHLLPLLRGGAAAVALLLVLVPVLASADALFAVATDDLRRFVRAYFSTGARNLLLAAAMTPFVFGLLYTLRRPAPLEKPVREAAPSRDALGHVVVLAALTVLYVLFLAVQSAGLFGGADYLAARGISAAEWARSGFFQMVGVTVVNLTVLLTALCSSRREGRGWRAVRLLSAVLVAESLVLLASAAWRMTLYVSAYGLSFKRCITYWGMCMMALFFLTAARKIRRPEFSFCRAAVPLALAGWIFINCMPVDWLVAKNQVDRYINRESPGLSVEYLVTLSYDTLSQLDRLAGQHVWSDYGGTQDMDTLLAYRRELAAQDCADWRTWSLSACLAAMDG